MTEAGRCTTGPGARRIGRPFGLHLSIALALVILLFRISPALEVTDEEVGQAIRQYGASAGQRLREWRDILLGAKNGGDAHKLELVNRFFNKVPYATDSEHWGKDDYWATPLELLATNGGDCEDYAIAKYLTLRELGVDAEKLRITYVKMIGANRGGLHDIVLGKSASGTRLAPDVDAAHMVLAYYATPGAEPVILDNNEDSIRPASQRRDLAPVYSFNGDSLWLAKELTGRGQYVGEPERLGPWRDLLKRLKK